MMQIGWKSLALLLALGIGNSHAAEPDKSTVYTENGVVHFVAPDVSVGTLTDLLFPQSKSKGLTRSLFGDTEQKAAEIAPQQIPVSVAMLIRFEFDSDNLTDDAKRRLDSIGNMLNQGHLGDRGLTVEGHTDIVGSEDYNMNLSMRRAMSVKQYLVREHNIESYRLQTSGKGESALIDHGDPKGSVNRRVQFAPYE